MTLQEVITLCAPLHPSANRMASYEAIISNMSPWFMPGYMIS